jgi:hypothetical protein
VLALFFSLAPPFHRHRKRSGKMRWTRGNATPKRNIPRVSTSADNQICLDRWLGGGQNFVTVCGAVAFAENGVGEIFRDLAPCNIAPGSFVYPGNVVSRLYEGPSFKTGLQLLFRGGNLILKLLESAAQTQEENKFGLGDRLRTRSYGENNGEIRLLDRVIYAGSSHSILLTGLFGQRRVWCSSTCASRFFYFDLFLPLGPGRRVPLNFRALSISALVQSLFATAPSRVGAGGWITPSLIQA